MEPQPSVKSYYFEKGYKDLRNTIKDSWAFNVRDANLEFEKFDTSDFGGAFHGGKGVAIYVFGTLFFGVISLFHIIILGIVTLIIYTAFSIVWGVDRIYRGVNKIFAACPHSGCYKSFDIPTYHCPNCNAAHTRLHPGPYGILTRTCNCGEILPQTFFNGRKKLQASCPHPQCQKPIDSEESKPLVLPIIGAPSVGKTCFVTSFTLTLKEEISVENEIGFEFTDKPSQLTYEQNLRTFNEGGYPSKTVETQPTAMNIFLKPKNKSLRRIMYLYDPAGEAYLDTTNTQVHSFYDYFSGAFFLIDPFSIPDFYHEHSDKDDIQQFKPSRELLEDIYDRIIINLEKNFNVKTDQKVKKPFAIIFTKADVYNLDQIIGEAAGENLMSEHPAKIKTIEDGIDLACQNFLENYEMGHVLDKFKAKFKNIKFFSVASQGKKSKRIEMPLNWILKEIDKGLIK